VKRQSNHYCWIPLLASVLLHTVPATEASAMEAAVEPGPPMASPEVGTPLYLEVVLNQTRQAQLHSFVLLDGRLFARARTLRQLGFLLAGHEDGDLLDLAAIPGAEARYEADMQRVHITASLELLSLPLTRLNVPADDVPQASTSPGLLLNYDLYASHDDNASNITAFAELRAFGVGGGVFSQTAVTRAFRPRGESWQGESVRLDSQWQWSFPESMLTLSVGDTFSGYLNWTRPVRMGGVRFGRNFGLQPYRITTPLPAFLGEATVPSAVELYVNGMRQYSGEVPAGPFQLTTLPSISGAGSAQLVITDAYGRARTIDFPFYAAQQLLAKGLSDWSVAVGVVREDYGLRSFSYGNDPVASGNLRYGVGDQWTVETHAELGGGLVNAGAGSVWLLGQAGVASASATHSRLSGENGWQYALAYQWNNGRFNVALDTQRTQGDYRDVASLYGQRPARISERALLGVNGGMGSLGLSYLRLAYPDEDAARYASAFWSHSFRKRWYASLSFNQNLDESQDRNAFLGLAYNFDSRTSVNALLQRNGDRNSASVDVSRPVPGDGGFGWRTQLRNDGGSNGGMAEIGWLGDYGRFNMGAARFSGSEYGYASANGGLVLMGGHLFASRNISDAFAVVSTDGVAEVPVKLENRLIGNTDANGMLLVTPLNAWQRNKLSIDPMELPASMRVTQVELLATPSDRAGSMVRFGMHTVKAAVLVLVNDAGEPLPLGSRVRIPGSEAEAWVGYDGEAYLDALQTRNALQVETIAGSCRVEFDYPDGAQGIPRIGPLRCHEETP
jgi:outer membrane usher protein